MAGPEGERIYDPAQKPDQSGLRRMFMFMFFLLFTCNFVTRVSTIVTEWDCESDRLGVCAWSAEFVAWNEYDRWRWHRWQTRLCRVWLDSQVCHTRELYVTPVTNTWQTKLRTHEARERRTNYDLASKVTCFNFRPVFSFSFSPGHPFEFWKHFLYL